MSEIGSGIDSPAIEQDPSVAQLQAQAQGVAAALLVALPETGFVGSINALSGLLTLQAGTSSTGVTVTVSSDGVSTISIGVTGFGTIITHDQAAAVVDSAVVAGAAYVQADFQSVIDKLNELLGALRTAGIIAP